MSWVQTLALCGAVITGGVLNAIIIGLIIKRAIAKAFKKKESNTKKPK